MQIRHHAITYPDGRYFHGKLNHQKDIDFIGLTDIDLTGLSVLDLATNDGFFAFWSEWHKASRICAVDVGSYENYDWGPNGPPDGIEKLYQPNKWEGFDFHHKNLNSRVEKHELSIYDIKPLGTFDVIFNFGLLYHLRHPQLAMDICREVCKGFMVLDTFTVTKEPWLPISFECGLYTGILTVTDFCAPTESCIASWMKKAGFNTVFIEKSEDLNRQRRKFIGVVDNKWSELFFKNPDFIICDDNYWNHVKERIKKR